MSKDLSNWSRKPNGGQHASTYFNKLKEDDPDEYYRRMAIKRQKNIATRKAKKELGDLREKFDLLMLSGPQALTLLNNATAVQLQKALNGDTQAYIAVVDRLMAKPVERKEIKNDSTVNLDGLETIDNNELEIILNQHLSNDEE